MSDYEGAETDFGRQAQQGKQAYQLGGGAYMPRGVNTLKDTEEPVRPVRADAVLPQLERLGHAICKLQQEGAGRDIAHTKLLDEIAGRLRRIEDVIGL